MIPYLPFIFFLSCGVISFLLWSKMLVILEKHGRESNSFFITLKTIRTFRKLIHEQTDPHLKRKYNIIFWAQLALIPVYIIGASVITIFVQ